MKMEMFLRKHGFKLVVLAVLLIIGGYFAYKSLSAGERSFPKNEPAYDFTLENLDGESVKLSDTNGTVRLLYFFFSNCPDVCPPTTHMMSKVQRAMKEEGVDGEHTRLISVTIDPNRDTPERLREFAGYYEADLATWDFLRGEEQEVWDIAKKFDVGVLKISDEEFVHGNLFTLIDKNGNVRKLYLVGQDVEAFDIQPIIDDMLYLAKK